MWPYAFTLFVLLETAHVVCPFVLAATHKGLCGLMFRRPAKYVLPPIMLFVVGMLLPMWALIQLYLIANAWHFTMQNFGVLQLRYPSWRWINFFVAFFGTALGQWIAPLVVQIHHWATDIWMSQRVSGRRKWVFLVAISMLAPIALGWNRTPWTLLDLSPPEVLFKYAKILIAFRYSISLAHFTAEAKQWRLSDPEVRAAIGADLCRNAV